MTIIAKKGGRYFLSSNPHCSLMNILSLPECGSWRRGGCPGWWASPTQRMAPPRACSPRGGKTRSGRLRGWPRMKYWTSCCQPDYNIGYWGRVEGETVNGFYSKSPGYILMRRLENCKYTLVTLADSWLFTHATFNGTVRRPEAMSRSSWCLSPLRNSTSQPSQRSTTFFSLVQTCQSRKEKMIFQDFIIQ